MTSRHRHERAHVPHSVCPRVDECGAEAVEVVFVLPLLIVFIVAILHFGLQMVAAEAFVGKADAAIMALDIDEDAVRQSDADALKASANSAAAFSSDGSMQVVSVSIGAQKQLSSNGASGASYIPLVFTVSCKLPSLIGQGDAKPIERAITRRILVKADKATKGDASGDGSKKDEATGGESTGDGVTQGCSGDSPASPDVAGGGAGNA